MEESLRNQVLGLVDSMRGKHGAESEIGKAAEDQDWGKFLDIWKGRRCESNRFTY